MSKEMRLALYLFVIIWCFAFAAAAFLAVYIWRLTQEGSACLSFGLLSPASWLSL